MSGGVVLILILLIRLAIYKSTGKSWGIQVTPGGIRWVVALLVLCGLFASVLICVLESGQSPLWVLVFLPLAVPGHLGGPVMIALGGWRAAWCFGWLSSLFRAVRPSAGAAHLALLTLGARRRAPAVPNWLRARVLPKKGTLGHIDLVNYGLLEALEGRVRSARAMMSTAIHFPTEGRDGLSDRLALDWLAADAASSGEWLRLAAWRWSSSRLGFFFGALARCRQRPDRKRRLALRVAWLVAPGRRFSWPLCRAALALREPAKPPAPLGAFRDLPTLAGATFALLSRPQAELARAVMRGWRELGGEGSLQPWWQKRAAALHLDAATAEIATAEAVELGLEQVAAGLPERVAKALPQADEDESLLLDLIEAAAAALSQMAEPPDETPFAGWLAAWANFRSLYDQAQQRGTLHFNAYQGSVHELIHWAAWLWNDREQRDLGYAVFSWLLDQADYFQNAGVAEVLARNLALRKCKTPLRRLGLAITSGLPRLAPG